MEKQICVRKRKGTENERKRKGRGKEKERMKEEERKRKNLSICVLMPFLEQVDRYHYIMVIANFTSCMYATLCKSASNVDMIYN